MNSTALILLSGGLNSATLLAHALDHDFDLRAAVFIDYGQQQTREAGAAREVAEHYGVDLTELDLRGIDAALPISAIVVPNRNAILLAVAAAIARSKGIRTVLTGVHADQPMHPDSRPEFLDAMSVACSLGCGVGVRAPFVSWTKERIAAHSHHLQVPVHYTWSCLEAGNVHCGRCAACVERAAAFHEARVPDPTPYADADFWRAAVADA